MPYSVVIACIDTRNPPEQLAALQGLDVQVQRVIGFENPAQAELYRTADAIITEMHPVTAEMMNSFDQCKIIACASTGFDYVDLAAATQQGIWVTNCPGYCTDEVATHTLALLLSQARRLPQQRQLVRQGEWDPRPVRPLQHPRTQTVGLIGWGRIGRSVSAKALALGFKVIAHDPYVDPKQMLDAGVQPMGRDNLLATSDYVSLHTPLTDETLHMIDAKALALMKPSAYLINTARGKLIVEEAVLAAIQNGKIAGAAVDVLASEPPTPDHPFLHENRIVVTPHSAWCSEEADAAVWEWAGRYVAAALRGQRPAGAVNQISN